MVGVGEQKPGLSPGCIIVDHDQPSVPGEARGGGGWRAKTRSIARLYYSRPRPTISFQVRREVVGVGEQKPGLSPGCIIVDHDQPSVSR